MADERAVFVASSDTLFREAAQVFFERRPGWTCAGAADDGVAALAALARRQPDALLVTTKLGRLHAPALANQASRRWPALTVVILGRIQSSHAHVVDPSAETARVLEALRSPPARRGGGPVPDRAREHELLSSLTPRERVVLRMVANGASLREAAAELGVSRHTVRTHVQNLYDKIDCHNRLDVVRFAERHGLIATGSAGEG